MKLSWRLISFGFAAYLVFLVATLPAGTVLARMQSQGISASGVSGSIWNGRAMLLRVGNTVLGETSWQMKFLPLFTGRASADISIKRDAGSAHATISKGFGKRINITRLQGALPIAALGGLGLPGGWSGDVRLQIAQLELENSWPTQLVGDIEATNLVGPANQPTALGNYRVEFPDATNTANGITGTLTSSGEGPLDVKGTLRLLANRTYVIDAQVATRPSAPESIAKALQYLGPPDARGRRPLSMSGSL